MHFVIFENNMKKIIVVLMIVLSWSTALAVCDRPEPKLCKSFFNSEIVIHGKVTDIKTIHDKDEFIAGWQYSLEVIKAYRGKPGRSLVVFNENASARIIMEKDKEYFVFAYRSPAGRWETGDDCGNYSGTRYSKAKENEILNLSKDNEAHFYGEVVFHDSLQPVPNVEIKIIGQNTVYTAKSDSKGILTAELTPGKYKIALPKGIEKSIISFADLNNINLVAGQCEQIQFTKK